MGSIPVNINLPVANKTTPFKGNQTPGRRFLFFGDELFRKIQIELVSNLL